MTDKAVLIFEDSEEEEELNYSDVYYLPILFNTDKSGKERMWKIWIDDNTVHRLQGLVDGKKQTYQRTFKAVNVGKKNETSAEEKAKQAAEKMWVDQTVKGYFPKCKEGKAMYERVKKASSSTGGHNINAGASIRGRETKNVKKTDNHCVSDVQIQIKPMKAGEWTLKDREDPYSVLPRVINHFDFDDGVYCQWKLDGWRCAVRAQRSPSGNLEVVMTSNNSKQFPWFSHLRDQFLLFVKGKEDLVLDGLDCEVYAHRVEDEDGVGMDDQSRFSFISSACGLARSSPHPLEAQLCLYAFDLIDLSGEMNQDERFGNLKKLFRRKPKECPNIILTHTEIAKSIDDIILLHDDYAQEGYEGIIIRSRELMYTDKRSLKMRKYKNFFDAEYPIIDVEKDEGVDDEYFVWVCHDTEIIDEDTGEPKRFKAKPKGSRENRRYWYENYLEYLGMPLTVKFQEYTEDGVPRFPIGIGIREDQ